MLKNIILFFFMMGIFSGCGTVGGRKNIIPFDSNPRGLMVYDEQGKLLGKTPFLISLAPKREHYFIYKLPDHKSTWRKKESYHCSFNWGPSITPNLVPSLAGGVGFIASGIFLGVDYLSGHIYSCDKPVFTKTPVKLKHALKTRNILVLPFFDQDLKVNRIIQDYWLKKQYESVKTTDRVIALSRSREALIFRGINHRVSSSFEAIDKRNLIKVASQFNATHVIFFKKVEEKKRIYIEPELYDLFTGKKVKASYLKRFEIDAKRYKNRERTWSEALYSTINFIPNSLSLTYTTRPRTTYTSSRFGINTGEEHGTYDHPQALPRIATLFGVSNILHPQLYNSWDYDITTFPVLKFHTWENRDDFFSTQVFGSVLAYNVGLTGHTPWGGYNLELGYGLGNMNLQDSLGLYENRLKMVTRVSLNYVGFIRERVYFTAGLSTYSLSSPVGRAKFYELESWSEGFFGLGYYFPNLKYIVSEWFDY